MKKDKRFQGFTLIELLVVIGIIVVLSVVVVLTLNPAELLKQARDSNRISDMATLKSSLALYLADVASPNLASSTNGTNYCWAHASSGYGVAGTSLNCYNSGSSTAHFVRAGTYATTSALTNPLAVDGTGWIPVVFTLISSGAPITALPVDSVNNAVYYYSYTAATGTMTYKVASHMESNKYSFAGGQSTNVENNDGGSLSSTYEVGSNLGL